MAREFFYRGRSEQELKSLSVNDVARLLPARERRSILRGLTEDQQKVLKLISGGKKEVETHCRDMVILPSMIGIILKVHSGKEFVPVAITSEMLGHRLGEFVLTRKTVRHSAPGVGATRSSAALSVK